MLKTSDCSMIRNPQSAQLNILVVILVLLFPFLVQADPLTFAENEIAENEIADNKLAHNQTFEAPVFEDCQTAKHGTAFYGAECAQVLVKGSSRKPVTLNILRVRARSTPKSDPLIVITGGPGTSAVAQAWQHLRFFYEIQKQRDILFIDQRGTGMSAPFNCEAVAKLDQSLPSNELVVKINDALIECAQEYVKSGFVLEDISTYQAALDLDLIRERLGYRSVNLWGNSYGTRVAMEYQRLFPDAARSVVIDGVAPGAIALPNHAELDARRALGLIFKECMNRMACQRAFGDLTQQWQTLLMGLAKHPIAATFTHPRTLIKQRISVTDALLANWVRFALYNRELAALLPLAIHQAVAGDFDLLANMALIAGDSISDDMSYAMHAAILCTEDRQAPPIARDLSTNLPELPFAALNNLRPACRAMPAPIEEHTQWLFNPIKSAVPTLILSGEFDPVTPPFWGEWASQNMAVKRHIVVPGGHHGVSGIGCMPDLIAKFIDTADPTLLNTDCIEQLKPVDFFIDGAGPHLSYAQDPIPPEDSDHTLKLDTENPHTQDSDD
jgi:pimeloyl-ACP methyl ester carboxylesterase